VMSMVELCSSQQEFCSRLIEERCCCICCKFLAFSCTSAQILF
jgi:hypothetical protein